MFYLQKRSKLLLRPGQYCKPDRKLEKENNQQNRPINDISEKSLVPMHVIYIYGEHYFAFLYLMWPITKSWNSMFRYVSCVYNCPKTAIRCSFFLLRCLTRVRASSSLSSALYFALLGALLPYILYWGLLNTSLMVVCIRPSLTHIGLGCVSGLGKPDWPRKQAPL